MVSTADHDNEGAFSVALFGTSNGVVKNGYAKTLQDSSAITRFKNFSLGASTSGFVFYRLDGLTISDYEFFIIDLCVNDGRWIDAGLVTIAAWRAAMLDLCDRILSGGSLPIILILPSPDFPDLTPEIRGAARAVAHELSLPFFDGYEYLGRAIDAAGKPDMQRFFRDTVHVHEWFGQHISRLIIDQLPLLRRGKGSVGRSTTVEVSRHQVVPVAKQLTANVQRRKTSLLGEDFALIRSEEEAAPIQVPANCSVISMAVDLVASRGFLMVNGENSHTQYATTGYARADWPDAGMLFGFRPLREEVRSTGAVTLKAVPELSKRPSSIEEGAAPSHIMLHSLIVREDAVRIDIPINFSGELDLSARIGDNDVEALAAIALSDASERTDFRHMEH